MASAIPPTAQMVGNAFVNQYYNVLHQWPHVVHRFYTDESRLTRAEAGSEGAVQSVASQAEIHKVVMSLGFEECRAEIKTVDSQDSFAGSVLVLVSGAMHRKNCRRNFVQSFFLAPQERGYYVLNDIFRYLDEDPQSVKPVFKVANGALDILGRLNIASEAEHEIRDFPPSPNYEEEAAVEGILEFPEHRDILEVEETGFEDRVPVHTIEAMSAERAGSIEQLSATDELQIAPLEEVPAEKKSYASILRFPRDNFSTGAQPAVALSSFRQASGNVDQPLSSRHLYSSSESPPIQVSANLVDDNALLEEEADVRSVYVRNLPTGITPVQIQEDLRRFGSVKPNSVFVKTIKSIQGGCYAFVDFEDANSARNAIEESPIMIGGQQAFVEEKRSTYRPGRGRGHALHGRGNFQNNGLRARGSSPAGASGKGPGLDSDRDMSNRGRGVRSVRSGYGGTNTKASSSDGYSKFVSQAGDGSKPGRRGASSFMP